MPLSIQTNPPSFSSISLSKSPTLSNSLHHYPFSPTRPLKNHYPCRFPNPSATKLKATVFGLFHRLRHLRRAPSHLRLFLLLSLLFFYFPVSHPSHSFILDFLTAFTFSASHLPSLACRPFGFCFPGPSQLSYRRQPMYPNRRCRCSGQLGLHRCRRNGSIQDVGFRFTAMETSTKANSTTENVRAVGFTTT